MKKSLVALAALAAPSAFAQSSVSITVYFDRGYLAVDNTDNLKDQKAVASNAGTTAIKFNVVQDLGGGLKAGFLSETNPGDLGGITQDATTTDVTTQSGGFNNGESFLNLSGGFGEIRLGSPNNELLTAATGVAAPGLSTGIGSTYSSNFSLFNGVGTGATGKVGIVAAANISATLGGTGVRGIRQANTIKYISPDFNGFKFAYGTAGKVNNGSTTTVDSAGFTDMSLRYTNGPLDVMYASLKIDTNGTATANTHVGTNAGVLDSTYTHSLLGATYTMGAFKIHAGTGGSKASADANVKTKSTVYGVTYTTGQWDLMANMAKVDDQGTQNVDRKMTGLGVNYNFSKTVRGYLRYDSLNWASNIAAAAGSEQKRTAAGVSVTF